MHTRPSIPTVAVTTTATTIVVVSTTRGVRICDADVDVEADIAPGGGEEGRRPGWGGVRIAHAVQQRCLAGIAEAGDQESSAFCSGGRGGYCPPEGLKGLRDACPE